jgi:hypothetical protein
MSIAHQYTHICNSYTFQAYSPKYDNSAQVSAVVVGAVAFVFVSPLLLCSAVGKPATESTWSAAAYIQRITSS